MTSFDPHQFSEKYHLALESALASSPTGGLCGYELEWNLLDSHLHPLLTVGSGPGQQSFVDYLRSECLSPWMRGFSQLEVFHWMIEWATRPYYHPAGAVYEGRLMEAVLINALHKAGDQFDERLFAWHGNLLFPTSVSHASIPASWHIAKRRYLERCVDLYGDALATAGTHVNLSLPEPLLAWDFMHLAPSERAGSQFDSYKSQFYITATRLMRAFATLFIATGASTPLQAQLRAGQPAVVLTEIDSVRNLTFPNPPNIDLPDLYRSYADYLRLSYDLVDRGIRFGNNNWTPTRARSFAEPVERLIAVTSEQLQDLYARGLYVAGEAIPTADLAAARMATGKAAADKTARQIEMQNLKARIDLPMARVEVRTEDGGHPLQLDVANLTLKHLLLLRFYADPEFARAFRYDAEDIARARRNEEQAARHGLRAQIENPFNAKPLGMRAFLDWTLTEVRPLAVALGLWHDLEPLQEMAAGGPNTAERLRSRLQAEIGVNAEVPLELLKTLAEEREEQVLRDVEQIAETHTALNGEAAQLGEFLQRARDDVRGDYRAPIRFRPRPEAIVEAAHPDKTGEIVAISAQLIRIPSVTACPQERLEEVHRAATFIYDYLRDHGLGVRYYNRTRYPAILAGFPGQMHAPVMLAGHFDVVEPDPDDGQFEPRIEGDYLWGRGAADMKTVVATYLVWLKDILQKGPPYPPVNLLLVGNEENGEAEPMGTPHVLKLLAEEEPALPAAGPHHGRYAPQLLVAGERTGESGADLWGEICTENRGVMRFEILAHGHRAHSGVASAGRDLSDVLLGARAAVMAILERCLTLNSPDGWQSQVRFPFIQLGTPGVYNITPGQALLGVEVRPIPQDDLEALYTELLAYCDQHSLELRLSVMESGIACPSDNLYLLALIRAVRQASGEEPRLGRKLPGTSARFAPGGQGVVWGQSGLAPHGRDERHYIPSILPYYRALEELGAVLTEMEGWQV